MAAKRHSVWRTPNGGVSLGYSGWKTFEECKEQFWNGYLEGGTGIEQVGDGWQFERCYGSAWHELWRACAVEGLRAADKLESYYGGWCEVEGYDFREPHVLALYRTLLEDLAWYFDHPGQIKIKTIMAEQELKAEVKSARTGLIHELRGTPDVVGEVEGEWGGGIYIVDGKTYKVIGADNRLYVDVNEFKKAKDGAHNAQFPAYMGLWNLTHPEAKPIFDGIAHFVPQRAAEVERMRLGRKGNQKPFRVQDEFVFCNPDQVQWTLGRWVNACDDIAHALDSNDPHSWFRMRANANACIDGSGGWVKKCPFLSLCEATSELREDLLSGAWQSRQLVEKKEAA